MWKIRKKLIYNFKAANYLLHILIIEGKRNPAK